MKKNVKIALVYLIIVFSLIMNQTLISAQNEYSISEGIVSFKISSQDGVYNYGRIMLGEEKIENIKLCENERCSGKLTIQYPLPKNSGNYSLQYYDYTDYLWKNIPFFSSDKAGSETAPSGISNNPESSREPSGDSAIKLITVTTICRLAHLFGGYEECRDKYL